LDLKKGSSRDLPYPDHSFDKVFCNMVVYFWEEPGTHLEEVYRVLKPDGLFYTGIRSNRSMQEFPFTKFGFSLYGKESWKSILNEYGFAVLEVKEKADPKMDFEGRELQLESICIVAQKN
ncbi:MAG: methyltransferase domain-containing protein, partial [Balneolaceae bacterium]|nr:methyltransferase domain-containing protein [Balneolaceae bacterium]